MSSHHEVLGVSVLATDDEIKVAYRKACMREHPDRGGSKEGFQRLQVAFEALQNRGPRKCDTCGGTGFIKTRSGIFVLKSVCPVCWKKE